jgi:hypothetical protein
LSFLGLAWDDRFDDLLNGPAELLPLFAMDEAWNKGWLEAILALYRRQQTGCASHRFADFWSRGG